MMQSCDVEHSSYILYNLSFLIIYTIIINVLHIIVYNLRYFFRNFC